MKTDMIYDTLECEMQRQEHLLQTVQQELKISPAGFLYIRELERKNTYYHVTTGTDGKPVHTKITNKNTLKTLLNKARNKALQKTCRNNIKVLKRALKNYTPLNMNTLLSEKQRELFLELYMSNPPAPYKKAPFDPTKHIHETVTGELVRSKGEVIIANALWHYGIPFNYEELFPYPDEDGNWFYPDFTIHCPDGTVIIWEHWGMLDKHTYCIHNAGKLHTYNDNNYVIGKNLILSQDDKNGNCSTTLVYHIIENYILPYFK